MSDFMTRKARTYLNLFDYDKDGYISEEDFGGLARQFAEAYDASEEIKEKLIKTFVIVWRKFMKSADIEKDCRLSAEILVESLKQQHYDPGLIIALYNLIRGMYELIDINQDGYLQPEEHQQLFKHLGVPEGAFDHKLAFDAIDANGDGKLSIDEFVESCFEFFFSEDETSPKKFYFGPLVN